MNYISKHVSGWLIDRHVVTLSASLALIGSNHTCAFMELKKRERKQTEGKSKN